MFYGRMSYVSAVFMKKRRIIVGDFINLILVILLILFIAGVVMAIAGARFAMRGEHPILSILFALLESPCIYVPAKFTIGFFVAKVVLVVSLIYSVTIVVLSIRNFGSVI